MMPRRASWRRSTRRIAIAAIPQNARLVIYYHDDTTISGVVASLMASMDKNPFDREGKPCSTIEEIRHVVAHYYGERAGKSVRITVH